MPISRDTQHRIAWGVLLGLLGFAGNWFKFELFFNVDFLFGSLFVALLCRRLGTGPAWFGALAGGAMGNLGNAFLHPPTHTFVGASTAVFAAIDACGYDGWVGAEYAPRGRTIDSLGWLRQLR